MRVKMKGYVLRPKSLTTQESKRIPLKDKTNVNSNVKRKNLRGSIIQTNEKTFQYDLKDVKSNGKYKENISSEKNKNLSKISNKGKKMRKSNLIEYEEVLKHIKSTNCKVILNKNKLVVEKIKSLLLKQSDNKIEGLNVSKSVKRVNLNEKKLGFNKSNDNKEPSEINLPKRMSLRNKNQSKNTNESILTQNKSNLNVSNTKKDVTGQRINLPNKKNEKNIKNQMDKSALELKVHIVRLKNIDIKGNQILEGSKMEKEINEGRRNLRKRNSKQNFAESILNETNLNVNKDKSIKKSINKPKVPIYRRISQLKEEPKKVNKNIDEYAFNVSSESDDGKSNKLNKKKHGHSLNTSLPFERYMKEIVKKLDEKHHKDMVQVKNKNKKGNRKKIRVNTKNVNKNDVKINKNDVKINKNDIKINKNDANINKNLKVNKNKEKTNKNTTKINKNTIKINKNTTKINKSQKNESKIQQKNQQQTNQKIKPPEIILSNLPKESKINITSNIIILHPKPTKDIPSINNSLKNPSPTNILDDYDDTNSINTEETPNVYTNTLSEHLKTPNVNRLDELDTLKTPIANSTMNNNDIEGSPWRFNIEVRRNPHFLQYKRSLLPNYNQEMVLDSSLIERRSFNKSSNGVNISGPVRKQTSILKYVSGGRNIENLENVDLHSTLFDAHEISPEKRLSSKKKSLENRENVEKVEKKKVEGVKRNILGEKVDNLENVMNVNTNPRKKENINTTQKVYSKKIKSLNKENDQNIINQNQTEKNISLDSTGSDFLGFDHSLNPEKTSIENKIASSEVNKEQNVEIHQIEREEESVSLYSSEDELLGFDLSKAVPQPRYSHGKPLRMDDVIPRIIKARKNVVFDVETKKKTRKEKIDKEADVQEIGLFEDYHPERNLDFSDIKEYKCRRPRRRRSHSHSATESEDDEHHQNHRPKRKKNLRTRQEEAAAEKWYAEFNKMCEEVEQFPLEIEKVT